MHPQADDHSEGMEAAETLTADQLAALESFLDDFETVEDALEALEALSQQAKAA